MTAIALLDVQGEPYLVSDSMLSRHTNQKPSDYRIWVPARGDIEAVQQEGDDGWRISAFVRKTVYLPNQNGIFAWSGSRPQAIEFWDRLAAKYSLISGFDPKARLTDRHVDTAYQETVQGVRERGVAVELSVLGCVLTDGKIVPIGLGKVTTIETKHFGECLLIGSGAACLIDCIKLRDKQYELISFEQLSALSPAHDLARFISSRLLFLETLKSGYDSQLVPINSYSGGYFEWHRIEANGPSFAPAHLDFHVRIESEKRFISRIYYSEMLYRKGKSGYPEPMRLVALLNNGDIELPAASRGNRIHLRFSTIKAAVLYQGLSDSDDYTNPDGSRDIAGRLDAEHLGTLFKQPQFVDFGTTFIFGQKRSPIRRQHSAPHLKHIAELTFDSSTLILEFDKAFVTE